MGNNIEFYKDRDLGDWLTMAIWAFNDDPIYAEGGDTKQDDAPAADAGNATEWGLNNQWREIADRLLELYTGNETYHHSHSNQSALDLIVDGDHEDKTNNPHSVTKTQIGLGSVENILSEYDSSRVPDTSDNASAGWAAGSIWIKENDEAYLCL